MNMTKHQFKNLLFLLCLMPFVSKAQTCGFQGEIIDSLSCNPNVILYHQINPIDTLNGTSYSVYWGDGTSSNFTIYNNSQFQMMLSHTYSQPGVYYPYVVIFSPCLDTFPIMNWGMTGLMNSVVVTDSCRVVNGYAYIDQNGNCNYDNGEQIPYALIKAYQNGVLIDMAYTNSQGAYELIIGNGNYTLEFDPSLTPSLTGTCGSSANPTNINVNNYNFVFSCSNIIDVSVTVNNASYSPVFNRPICFTLSNKSCYPANNAIVNIVLDPRLNYVFASNNTQNLLPVVQGDTVTFYGINLNPFESFHGCIYVVGDTNLTMLDTLCVTAFAYVAADANLTNNTAHDCSPVNNSYDPNMKEVSINGMPAEGFVLPNETMTYTLHFQNTGNAPALRVVIRDTLPNVLDPSTVELVDASHHVILHQLSEKLVFEFNNIMLPDSASDPHGSQGYVTFKVKQKPNLAPGTLIPNNCSIYFDYNPPIVTNTVLSQIAFPTNTNKSLLNQSTMIFPNPASDKLNIRTDLSNYHVIINDLQGKRLASWNNAKEISLNGLNPGIYILSIQSNDTIEYFKIIKQ